MDKHQKIIDELIRVALNELQHDTGQLDDEYYLSRAILNKKFRKILGYPTKELDDEKHIRRE